jgi:predicted nuclease of restriction endonuclease-like RecB superfamily
MLTADLVRVRKRAGVLYPALLDDAARERLRPLASAYLDVLTTSVGESREAVLAGLAELPVGARDRLVALGLRKLLLDEAEWSEGAREGAEALRREVFGAAATAWKALGPGDTFDRAAVLDAVARAKEADAHVLEAGLYADLHENDVLVRAPAMGPDALLDAYDLALAQSLLLRAERVRVALSVGDPATLRLFFRRLRFLGLLYVVKRALPPTEKTATGPLASERGIDSQPVVPPTIGLQTIDGPTKPARSKLAGPPRRPRKTEASEAAEALSVEIDIDGPFSLFDAAVRYGVKLAQLVPLLAHLPRWGLVADVRWGRAGLSAVAKLGPELGLRPVRPLPPATGPELDAFCEGFRRLASSWDVRPSDVVFSLPGEVVCVPDLAFTRRETKHVVHLEAFGFWSRAAVWTRVELLRKAANDPTARAQLPGHLLLAVSSKLRVSEEVLGEGELGEVYVYGQSMSPRAVLERLERLMR